MIEAFAQIILVTIFYWSGWVVLRVITLGRYPPIKGTEHDYEFVAVVGVLFSIAILVAVLEE